jgi:hypothetical protein
LSAEKRRSMKRIAALVSLLSLAIPVVFPKVACADRRGDKKAFLATCDESISVARLCGAPHKFIGKHVDIHGMVGPAMDSDTTINIRDVDDPTQFVVIVSDFVKGLGEKQWIRVMGTVQKPVSGKNTKGAGGVRPVVRGYFVS